ASRFQRPPGRPQLEVVPDRPGHKRPESRAEASGRDVSPAAREPRDPRLLDPRRKVTPALFIAYGTRVNATRRALSGPQITHNHRGALAAALLASGPSTGARTSSSPAPLPS